MLDIARRKDKERNSKIIEKEEQNQSLSPLSLSKDNMIIYIENPKESTENYLKIGVFNKFPVYKIKIQNCSNIPTNWEIYIVYYIST